MTVSGSVLDLEAAELLQMDGSLLVRIREELRLEPQAMATRLGCHVSTLNRYENNKLRIPAHVIRRVNDLLDEERKARQQQAGPAQSSQPPAAAPQTPSAGPHGGKAQPQQQVASPQPAQGARWNARTERRMLMGGFAVLFVLQALSLMWLQQRSQQTLEAKLDRLVEVWRGIAQQREAATPAVSPNRDAGGTCAVQPGSTDNGSEHSAESPGVLQDAASSQLAGSGFPQQNEDGGVADGGQPREARPAAPEPLKGQKMAPCTPSWEVEMNRACWVGPTGRAPCPGNQVEYNGECYVPAWPAIPKKPRPPVSQ